MTSIAAIPALRTLSSAVLSGLVRDSRPVRFDAGALIRPAGEPACGVVLLLSGTIVATYAGPSGSEVWPEQWTGPHIVDKAAVLATGGWVRQKGAAFPVHSAPPASLELRADSVPPVSPEFAGQPTPTGLMAITAVTARLLHGTRFLRLLSEQPAVREHVLSQLARDALAGRTRLLQAVTLPAVGQIAAWLAGRDPADRIAWRGSQTQLARLLGCSRVTVNRALARLVDAGAVRLTDRGIAVTDRDRLASLARGPG